MQIVTCASLARIRCDKLGQWWITGLHQGEHHAQRRAVFVQEEIVVHPEDKDHARIGQLLDRDDPPVAVGVVEADVGRLMFR